MEKWLTDCENDMKCGRDQRKYTILVEVLMKNGYRRVDSFLRELFVHDLLTMTFARGVEVTHGLVASVLLFAKEDVDRIERKVRYP